MSPPRVAVLALGIAFGAAAQTPMQDRLDAGALAPQEQQRYQQLVNELRCLVCQNQTIADSDAPIAADLRAQVHRQLVAGRSDAEIRDYLTARYGDFVLYRPPFKASTWFLWLGPFLLLVGALMFALSLMRRRAPPPRATVDAAQLQSLLDQERERP